ncbi:MAG TPA: AsmA family protein [Bryobacteraceae bacterium]|jgi:AsmA protein|nr:AsmA family protein [Bryobacteraceae bacterium]
MRRRLVIILSAVAAAIVVAVILFATFFNVNRYRPQIEAELQKRLNRPVTLGTLHLRLFSFSLKVDGLTIQESPASASSRPFATAQEVYVSAGLFSLLHGQPDIHSIRLQRPQIELIKNSAGVWNFSNLGSSGIQNGQHASSEQSLGQLTLSSVKITDGQIAVTDESAKNPRTVYNHIDASVSDFALGKRFDLDLAGHFPGEGKETIAFKGKAGPVQPGNIPVDGKLSIQQVSLAAFNAVANGAIPPQTDAVASGDATIQSAGDVINCKGSVTLIKPVVRGAPVPYSIDAQYDLSLEQKTDALSIRSGTVKIGPTVVSLNGAVNSSTKPAKLNLHVGTTNASVPELMSLAALVGAASNSSVPIKGSLTANLTVTGSSTSPNVQGDLSSSSLQAENFVLTNVQAKVNTVNGSVGLSPESAMIFGGREDGDITLDTKAQHPLCHVKSKLTGVDTNALLTAISSLKDTLYGSLEADGDLSFALDSGPNLASTLNGTLGFNVTHGHLKNVNIMSELSKVGRFLGSAPAQSASGTDLQRFSGTLKIQNGVATTNNLVAVMAEGSLSGTGSTNFASQALDLHVTAALSSGTTNSVGGTGVGGFLNTALANNKGELVLPVLVTGTTAHPVFAPDMQALAKMKLNHLLPTSADPTNMTSGLIGSLVGNATGNKPSGNKAQQQNPVNSILNQFVKKKH